MASRFQPFILRAFHYRKYSNVTTSKEPETPFIKHLRARIEIQGSLSLGDYMKEVLTNPLCGYYMHRDAIGSKGDFITSPEISQVFGELIGLWFISNWHSMDRPNKINLVEVGPGKGTLMKDMLRTFQNFKDFHGAISSIHLVEASPTQRFYQQQLLCHSNFRNYKGAKPPQEAHEIDEGRTTDGLELKWHSKIEDLPQATTFLIAHEFFDALPIQQFRFTEDGWREILIDIDEDPTHPQHFKFSLAQTPTLYSKTLIPPERFPTPTVGDQIEVSPDAEKVVSQITQRIHDHNGLALIVDYGENYCLNDSLRAIRKHKFQDPLLNPGTADLSADVDFSFLRYVAETREKKVRTCGPITQRDFLFSLGIQLRMEMLLKQNPELKAELQSEFHRLTAKNEMGEKYKFLSFSSLNKAVPIPF